MTKESICNSCKKKLTNIRGSTIFKCPNCGEGEIIRCYHCRDIGARYTCKLCQFSGPN